MKQNAFTLVELLTVIAVIAILAGLVLGVAGPIQIRAARIKAHGEIQAFSAACESYKADYGNYPRDTTTDALDARINGDSHAGVYKSASLFLYKKLTGDTNADGSADQNDAAKQGDPLPKSYMEIKPGWCGRDKPSMPASSGNPVTHLIDPFGLSYGYSTAYQKYMEDLESGNASSNQSGYNPTFDLWSTAGIWVNPSSGSDSVTVKWVKNW